MSIDTGTGCYRPEPEENHSLEQKATLNPIQDSLNEIYRIDQPFFKTFSKMCAQKTHFAPKTLFQKFAFVKLEKLYKILTTFLLLLSH